MEFFVSWTKKDPVFQSFDPNANVLVSPHYVPQSWSVSDWTVLPSTLLLDSGAYSINEGSMTYQNVLDRQISMSKGWNDHKKLYFCHPDLLIPRGCGFYRMNCIIRESLDRAKRYIDLIKKKRIKCIPLGVIHGFDDETLISSYQELKSVGYKHFALGSMARRISHSKELCLDILRLLSDYFVSPLHLFGVLWPSYANTGSYNLTSFDSASPSKMGFYGTVLYGPDLNKYVIAPNSKQKMRDHLWKFRKSIETPLPCNCPVCSDDPMRLIQTNLSKAKSDRTIHNYFQIKWATEKIN